MSFFVLLVLVSLFTQNQVFSSPVLLWSNSNLPQTAVSLSTISPLDIISNDICSLPSEQIQIRLFAVNGLTNEDIQHGSQNNHQILQDAKKEKSHFRYFPNVRENVYQEFALIDQSNNMHCSRIRFQVTSSKMYDTLHDALNAMQESIASVGTNTNTVIAMALTNGPVVEERSLSRTRRALSATEEDIILSEDNSCMFYASALQLGEANQEGSENGTYTLDLDASSCTPLNSTADNSTVTAVQLELVWINGFNGTNGTYGVNDTVKMSLVANITGRYWYLEEATLNGLEYRYFAYGMHSKMDTPPDYSYVCTTATFVRYDSSVKHGLYDFKEKFSIKHLQFQPFNANGSYFGPPNYCTSFFTSGIWMGITSSLLCLAILLFGVHRMMSIQSNDRLDDPKGKPLVIKAQE